MAVTIVQTRVGASNFGGTTLDTDFSSNNTAGNTIVVMFYWFANSGAPAITGVTDTRGNSYSAVSGTLSSIAGNNYSRIQTQFWIATGIGSGANTVTGTWDASTSAAYADLIELTPSSVDQSSQNTHANTDTPDAGSITPSVNGTVILCNGIIDNGTGIGSGYFTAGTNFTLLREQGAGSANFASETYAQATASSANLTFVTTRPDLTGPNVCSGASFKSSSDTSGNLNLQWYGVDIQGF